MTSLPASSSSGVPCAAGSMLLSVIVPAFNEEDTVGPPAEEVTTVLASLQGGYELLEPDA